MHQGRPWANLAHGVGVCVGVGVRGGWERTFAQLALHVGLSEASCHIACLPQPSHRWMHRMNLHQPQVCYVYALEGGFAEQDKEGTCS